MAASYKKNFVLRINCHGFERKGGAKGNPIPRRPPPPPKFCAVGGPAIPSGGLAALVILIILMLVCGPGRAPPVWVPSPSPSLSIPQIIGRCLPQAISRKARRISQQYIEPAPNALPNNVNLKSIFIILLCIDIINSSVCIIGRFLAYFCLPSFFPAAAGGGGQLPTIGQRWTSRKRAATPPQSQGQAVSHIGDLRPFWGSLRWTFRGCS